MSPQSNKLKPLLILMIGLPLSGKSTKAGQLAADYGYPIVCPDSVRRALHGQRFSIAAEPYVWAIVKTMAHALFLSGHSHVILDATNITKKRREAFGNLAWDRRLLVVRTDAKTCIDRAKGLKDTEIIPVIHRMADQWEECEVIEPFKENVASGC